MCCTRLAENTDRKNYAKNRHVSTIAQLCRATSLQLRYVSTIGKKLVKRQISPAYVLTICWTSAQLTAEIFWRVWGTSANFNEFRVLASLLQRRPSKRRSTKLCTMFGRLLGGTLYIHFRGLLPRNGILPRAKFALVQILRSPVLAALLHGTRAVGVSESLRRRKRNGITELLQRAPPIFGWATITLGIGVHSSYILSCPQTCWKIQDLNVGYHSARIVVYLTVLKTWFLRGLLLTVTDSRSNGIMPFNYFY